VTAPERVAPDGAGPPGGLAVYCLCVGESYPDRYVERLHSMLLRHLGEPFHLTCWTDRPRDVPAAVRQVDVSSWGLSGWFCKLRLFDPAVVSEPELLYLDVTQVLKGSLAPLLRYARSSGKSLVAVNDWYYPCINSCCMYVRPDGNTRRIWQAWVEGRRYDTWHAGDQDFIHAAAEDMGISGRVGCFPEGMVESYKRLRRLRRTSPGEAARALDGAAILKFHGEPKMHDLEGTWDAVRLGMRKPFRFLREWNYLRREIRAWWR
jgi:hypothetical protein